MQSFSRCFSGFFAAESILTFHVSPLQLRKYLLSSNASKNKILDYDYSIVKEVDWSYRRLFSLKRHKRFL